MIKSLAILTSGGDAPGMNAAIRAAARAAFEMGVKAYGVRSGYKGLMEGDYIELGPREVGGILQLGGTILGSARSPEFKEEELRRKAIDNLNKAGIDGLVVIGGNGTQTGAKALTDMGLPAMGVASTIDNDLVGSDITLGVDTALNVALESIDRLKVTAASHKRAFIVEVMGRDCGYLAIMAAIAGGAEAVTIPEVESNPEDIAKVLNDGWDRGKRNGIVVVSEGAKYDAEALMAWFKENKTNVGFELRSVTLGHVQRGGAPTAFDRILGSELGARAAQELIRGNQGQLVGKIGGKLHLTPLSEVAGITKGPDLELLKLAESLAI